MLPFLSPGFLTVGGAVAGQQVFNNVGGTFTVPAGVTSISVVGVGRGAAGATALNVDEVSTDYIGGAGGALSYVNNIAVTPGETLDIQVSDTLSRLLRGGTVLVSAGAGSGTIAGSVIVGTGFAGGNGSRVIETFRSGAGAGGYTSAGGNAGFGTLGGGGVSLLGGGAGGSAAGNANANGGAYGGGGGASGSLGAAGPGGVRIIWGAGRAFPNTNTGDV